MEVRPVRKKLKIYIDSDEPIELPLPTVKNIKRFVANLDDGKISQLDLMIKFLMDLGMDEDVIENMQIDHVSEIVSAIMEHSKKK